MLDEKSRIGLSVALVALLIIVFAVPTSPPFANVMAGFFPLILTLVVGIAQVRLNRSLPPPAVFGIPIVLSVFLGIFGLLDRRNIFFQLEGGYLALVNALGGIAVMTILTQLQIPSPTAHTPSHIKHHIGQTTKLVHALNEVIKRVYSPQKGANVEIRNELMFSYKQAESLEHHFARQQYDQAHAVVHKIYEQLRRLFDTELIVFGRVHLKGLKRKEDGSARVVDVLIENDPEAVRVYVESMAHSLQSLNEELLGLRRKK